MINHPPALEFKSVRKSIKGRNVLENINISFYSGEVTCILGLNGAGKSTLMRAAMNLVMINEGKIKIHNKHWKSDSSRKDTIFIPDIFSFYPYYTVRQTILFFSSLHGSASTRINQLYPSVISSMKLSDCENSRIDTLTKGQLQRTALAYAFLTSPDTLLMDEPFNGLYQFGIEHLKSVMRSMKKEIKTVIFSTHSIGDALEISDRFVILKQGKITGDFKVKSIKNRKDIKKFLNGFLS